MSAPAGGRVLARPGGGERLTEPERDRHSPRLVSAGPPESFEAFFERLLPRAISTGSRILGSRTDGEDAAVEGLARAYAYWDRVGQLSYRDAWVLRVTANVAYDHARRTARSQRHEPTEVGVADATDVVDLRRTLVPLLRQLSRRQREVLILHHIVGLTSEEIAAALGCSVGSVKTHARRALDRLRSEVPAGLLGREETS